MSSLSLVQLLLIRNSTLGHFSSGCFGEKVLSDAVSDSISSHAMVSSYLLCSNCVASCIVTQSLDGWCRRSRCGRIAFVDIVLYR